jgi:hypothetical protein
MPYFKNCYSFQGADYLLKVPKLTKKMPKAVLLSTFVQRAPDGAALSRAACQIMTYLIDI